MAPTIYPNTLDLFEIWDSSSVVEILAQTVAQRE